MYIEGFSQNYLWKNIFFEEVVNNRPGGVGG